MLRPGGPSERAPLDFTTSLYLGMRHPSASLARWEALTTGAPAALVEPPGAASVAQRLAALVGCDRATLGVSTMHLFFDWFGTRAATQKTLILWDDGMYPIANWGVGWAVAHGARAQSFTHFAPASLAGKLKLVGPSGLRPIVVTDGYCPGCGRAAPLAAYGELARRSGGLLVLDDTQALGVFGARPDRASAGGGGSLRHAGLGDAGVVWIASLAKGFGVPMAALAGRAATVERFEQESETRVHASPPSAASIAAAARALVLNQSIGDALRRRLRQLVRRFHDGLASVGLSATGDTHAVQLINPIAGIATLAMHEALTRAGLRTVPLRSRCRGGSAVGFVITAAHGQAEIDQAVNVLAATVRRLSRKEAPHGVEGATRCRDRANLPDGTWPAPFGA